MLMVKIRGAFHGIAEDAALTLCREALVLEGAKREPLEFRVGDEWCKACAEAVTRPVLEHALDASGRP